MNTPGELSADLPAHIPAALIPPSPQVPEKRIAAGAGPHWEDLDEDAAWGWDHANPGWFRE